MPRCPYCQHDRSRKVRFTPWGGVLGPAIMRVVACAQCGQQFSGRNGSKIEGHRRVYSIIMIVMLALLVAYAIKSVSGPAKLQAGNARSSQTI